MPTRPRRHQLEGSLVYHVFNRCAIRGTVFHIEEDFRYFLGLLKRYKERFLLDIYHWVIMNTHFHLLVELGDPVKISSFMAGITHAYTHYHHKQYSTRGFLWQGRFKLQPVYKERYLSACGRYIERNPVRAGIIRVPDEYPWSSARFYCCGIQDGITREDPLYPRFGPDTLERRISYQRFLSDNNPEEEEIFRKPGKPVGSESFSSLLKLVSGRLMPQRRGRPKRHGGWGGRDNYSVTGYLAER